MAEDDKMNHKKKIDRTGMNYDTDPEGDAEKSAKITRIDRSKPETGVKIVKRH